jgi:GNAT superfamily N-acetyltransferase
MKIVRALPQDCEKILELIKDLAEYEKAPHEVKATVKDLEATLFSSQPSAFCDLAKVDGETVGFAIWFLNYSTWQGKYGIYLEDLFVKPEFRGAGYGKDLLKHLAKLCIENGYGRLQWWVLDWNKPAIDFYLSLGAKAMDEWTVFRVSGDALKKLADQ